MKLTKSEKIEILTEAYKEAEEKLNEALEILLSAHDETETEIDYLIEQELKTGYMNNLREKIINCEDSENWEETLEGVE